MGCGGCSSGRGCTTATADGLPTGCRNNGSCGTGGCNKLNVFDWLANMELPAGQQAFDVVEIRFKNSRKDFFRNVNGLTLSVGDAVAVEASPGHDIGTVSMTGELVRLQLRKRNVALDSPEIKKVYRKARQADVDKWKEAQDLERETMIKARQIVTRFNLQMKIGDVEYQGDKTKAIFYYTADERIDFRELIKVLAEEFRVRIEMRQIGARQEAARIGGIGSCGRELCCSTWLTDFRSVTTSAARYQQLSLNPLKLAGQCGKLKCCLNYELDTYVDALKGIPDAVPLETIRGVARHQKTDIFRRTMWYTFADEPDKFIALPVDRVREVAELNKNGEKPEELSVAPKTHVPRKKEPDYENVVGQDSLTRFDSAKRGNNKKRRKKGSGGGGEQRNAQPQQKQGGGQQKPQGQGQQQKPQGQKKEQPQKQHQQRQQKQSQPGNNPQQKQGGQQQQGGNNKNRNNNRRRRPDRPKGQQPGSNPPPAQ